MEWILHDFKISTEKDLLSVKEIHEFLTRNHGAVSRAAEEIEKSIENSLCFGMYCNGRQVGFARVISDFTTVYFLSDFFIMEEFRGKGLGKWMLECITGYSELKNLIGFLATRNAHGLYRKYGFRSLRDPRIMMLKVP
ncbi:MAG TPA: GNAT family N-acetyltransferase [Syntrophales bacterium]|nr:GNAT family N-acetyltransferase [Syntrophales bacterium]